MCSVQIDTVETTGCEGKGEAAQVQGGEQHVADGEANESHCCGISPRRLECMLRERGESVSSEEGGFVLRWLLAVWLRCAVGVSDEYAG